MSKECHCEIERDAWRAHCAIDWIRCLIAYGQCDVVSIRDWAVQWLLRSNELRFLWHHECKVDLEDLRAIVSTEELWEKSNDAFETFFLSRLLVQEIVVEEIVDVIIVDLHEGDKEKIRTILVQLGIPHRCRVQRTSLRHSIDKRISAVNWDRRRLLLRSLIVTDFSSLSIEKNLGFVLNLITILSIRSKQLKSRDEDLRRDVCSILTNFLPRWGPIELKTTSKDRGINPGLFNGPIIVYVFPEPVMP